MERELAGQQINHFLPIYFPGCVLYMCAFVCTHAQTQRAVQAKELFIISGGFGSIFLANLLSCIISFYTQNKSVVDNISFSSKLLFIIT